MSQLERIIGKRRWMQAPEWARNLIKFQEREKEVADWSDAFPDRDLTPKGGKTLVDLVNEYEAAATQYRVIRWYRYIRFWLAALKRDPVYCRCCRREVDHIAIRYKGQRDSARAAASSWKKMQGATQKLLNSARRQLEDAKEKD